MGSSPAGIVARQLRRPIARLFSVKATAEEPRKTCLYDLHVDHHGIFFDLMVFGLLFTLITGRKLVVEVARLFFKIK